MKTSKFLILSGVIAGMMAAGSASATTAPGATKVFDLAGGTAISLGSGVKPRGWYDERKENPVGTANAAYGKLWTHNSKWGYFNAESGKTYTITVVSSDANLHPGVSVWYRTHLRDTAGVYRGNVFVKDHLLSQTSTMSESSPVDSTSSDPVNDKVSPYSQVIQTWGYDQDGAENKAIPSRHPIKDGVEGTLSITFTASNTGTYLLVVGGINPNAAIPSATADYPVTVQVQEVTTTPK